MGEIGPHNGNPRGFSPDGEASKTNFDCGGHRRCMIFARGEKGVVRNIQPYKSTPPFPPDEIYLTITAEYEGRFHVGFIFESFGHLEFFYYKPKEIIGQPLREVGDIEIN